MSEKITKSEFESMLRGWAEEVKSQMRDRLKAGTSGSGYLASELKTRVGESKRTATHYIGFNLKRYGVFVAYGVGRGWIRKDGHVVRGSRVKKDSEMWKQMLSKGYTKKDIADYVVPGKAGKQRKPVDWFDSVLLAHIDELGDVAAEYYGDNSMERLLEMVNRMTIRKNYTGPTADNP